MPQPQTGQRSQFNDFHMFQQHIMLKQLQDPQVQQQFQELGDSRQQINYVNQQSTMNKPVLGPWFPPLINQKPIQDSSDMFQVQGFSNALAFSRDQSDAVSSYETGVPSDQDLDSLDPLEQKILFNMDDNSWNNTGTGSLENADNLSAFSSLHSGSWSALMQSAVAETTSSDTGLQEEWSGLSYQNPDLSSNQPSNFVDSVNQQHNSWADDNLQSASALCSNPELLFNNSNSSGFNQSGTQLSFKQEDGLCTDMTHKSFQHSPKNTSNWLDYNAYSFIDPNATGETSQHMLDLHKANKSTVSCTSSGTSIPSSTRSQLQSQHESSTSVACQSPQEVHAVMGSRFSDFTPACSQNFTNPLDRQFPFLRANSSIQLSVTSGLSFTTSPPDIWTNVPGQQTLGLEPQAKLDFEAFGRSLKPSYLPPQNYSLLNQINPVKNEKTLSMVSEIHGGANSDSSNHQQHLQALSQSGSQCNFTNSNVASNRTEQSKINLQMAPTWFNHYGTLNNEQIWSMHEQRAANNTPQHFFLGKPLGNLNSSMMQVKPFDVSQVNGGSQTASTNSMAVTNLAPPNSLAPNVTDQNLGVLRPKKRKFGTFEILPWHKAVTQGSQGLQNISTAELVWAKAVNRLVEKVDLEAQIVEAIVRPKKRLVLTTQLMQQLFQPVPAVILLGDATKNYFSAAYFAARLALADACNLTKLKELQKQKKESLKHPLRWMQSICCVKDSNVELEPLKKEMKYLMSFEKPESSGRIRDHYFSKSVEDFSNRSKWIEEALLSLDNRVSVSDLRVESQELDKFSVINRLAKFHRRGPPAAAESSTGPNLNTQRMLLQRYVIAHPMPRTVPEGTKCTSL